MTRINVRRGIAALALALGLLLASKPAGAATGTLDIWRWLSGFLPMSTLAGADGVDSRPALSKAGATWGAQHTVTANEGGCIEPNGCPHKVLPTRDTPSREGADTRLPY